MSSSEGQRELDDNEALSCTSKSTTAKRDTKFCGLECDVDGVALLTSLSSLAETNGSVILEKKHHARAEADSSSSSSGLSSVGSTRSSTHSSDIASQLDEDEEIFEDASSVLPDGMEQVLVCTHIMMYTCAHILTYTRAHIRHTNTHMHTLHVHTLTQVHTHTQTCTHTCMHTHTHTHKHMQTCALAHNKHAHKLVIFV